jgi:hypothetical protein
MGEACAKYFSARAGAFHLQQCAAASIGHRRVFRAGLTWLNIEIRRIAIRYK